MSARARDSSPLEIAQQHVITELILERDEARADRNCLHDLHNKNAIHFKELLDLCATLRQKRDEAMEDRENSRQSLAFALEELAEARAQQASARESTLRLDVVNFKLRKELAAASEKIKNKTDRIWNLKVALIKATKRGVAK